MGFNQRKALLFGQGKNGGARKRVGIARLFGDGKQPVRPERPIEFTQTGRGIGNFPQNRDEKNDIETIILERQCSGVALNEANVGLSGLDQLSPRLVQHLSLDVEQLQSPARDASRHLHAEVSRARANFEHMRILRQMKAVRQRFGRKDEPTERQFQGEGKLIGADATETTPRPKPGSM